MQLGSSIEIPEVFKRMNREGINYVELIKTNFQFVYGKDVPIEILSKVTPPDTWQVTVLRTENGLRCIDIVESGEGLTNVLKKVHYQSGEMLAYSADDPELEEIIRARQEAHRIDVATSVADVMKVRNNDGMEENPQRFPKHVPNTTESDASSSAATAPLPPREEASKAYKETLDTKKQPKKKYRHTVMFIHLSGCGEAVVGEQCQLSVSAIENRVRFMMQIHGRVLFGEENANKMPAVMFHPDNAAKWNVIVKGVRVNDTVALLGPQFGDDLEAFAESVQAGRPVKLQIELKWNGEYLPGVNRDCLSSAAAATAADAAN